MAGERNSFGVEVGLEPIPVPTPGGCVDRECEGPCFVLPHRRIPV